MSNVQIPLNAQAVDTTEGQDGNGVFRQLGSLRLSIDDKTAAYVAAYPGAGAGGFIVVPNQLLVGNKTVTVTSSATDVNGTPLPAATIQYDIVGATPPPPATQVVFGTPRVGGFPGVPPDPGAAAIII